MKNSCLTWIVIGFIGLWFFNSCSAPSTPDYTAREAYDVAATFAKNQLLNPVEGKGGPNIVTEDVVFHLVCIGSPSPLANHKRCSPIRWTKDVVSLLRSMPMIVAALSVASSSARYP